MKKFNDINNNTFLIVSVIIMVLLMILTLSGCNKSMFDTTYSFDKAIISLPNGEIIEDEVVSWTDYSDGDQIQVTLKDGNTYLVHANNIALINTNDN